MNGTRLKKVRKGRGYTQVSLAEALGVSKDSVAIRETRKGNPEFETLEQLLSIILCPPAVLPLLHLLTFVQKGSRIIFFTINSIPSIHPADIPG